MSTQSRQINLRYHVRVHANCKALVTIDETETELQEADIKNISRAGLMLSCPPELADRFVAGRKVGGQHEPLVVTVAFNFGELVAGSGFEPPADTDMLFSIAAVFAHANRRSRAEFHVGLSYLRLTAEQQDLLDAFIQFVKRNPPTANPDEPAAIISS